MEEDMGFRVSEQFTLPVADVRRLWLFLAESEPDVGCYERLRQTIHGISSTR